jgi:hypothetical protein
MSAMSMSKVAYGRRVGAGRQPVDTNSVTTTIDRIVTYIPTEVIVMYTAAVAAISAAEPRSSAARWVAFWVMLVASPVVVWSLYSVRVRASGQSAPLKPNSWPLLEMTFSTIAFATWAFALPDSPFSELAWYSAAVAAAAVVMVTTALGLVVPLFRKPLPA